jgi:hypothetical protein
LGGQVADAEHRADLAVLGSVVLHVVQVLAGTDAHNEFMGQSYEAAIADPDGIVYATRDNWTGRAVAARRAC